MISIRSGADLYALFKIVCGSEYGGAAARRTPWRKYMAGTSRRFIWIWERLPRSWARPYGLGLRVSLYVVASWSKDGWVNSQGFDHTSVIRFVEARFDALEPNISAWRSTVEADKHLTHTWERTTRNPFDREKGWNALANSVTAWVAPCYPNC
jgi:phospholipase C